MRGSVLAGLLALLCLAACESRLNPFNWFGTSEETSLPVEAAEAPTIEPQDPRPTVDQITALTVDRIPGGALVTAIGIPATQGWAAAALVPVARDDEGEPVAEDGVMTFRLVAVPPVTAEPVGSARSREISAGVFLSDQALEPVRTITVRAASNQRSSRR
ncbi:MAG: hypothetical protein AAF646_08120 [Pseudomonadota bacterium]